MYCRGIRGATTVEQNTEDQIIAATTQLLEQMIDANDIDAEYVASVIFTTTTDLNAQFPAAAARQMGWTDAALMCSHEMEVPGSLKKCIRILLHLNTDKSAREINHVYIKGAKDLKSNHSFQD
ncbi:MAG: chorismate mutase [Chloroflexi bacterium]|nr:chorismate mutase [Chloroflexota bacterium]MBT7081559.1 chorismate mutase [Chloroflexota bacterium]